MRVRVSAVFERGEEILCMRFVYGGKDVYALPGGGVDRDIPLHQAITEEWRTELGLRLQVGDIIMVGEAPGTKRHPQTLHIIFAALEVIGTPKVRSEHTRSLEAVWVPLANLKEYPLYPDVGKQLYEYFFHPEKRSIEFIRNCMERGFW